MTELYRFVYILVNMFFSSEGISTTSPFRTESRGSCKPVWKASEDGLGGTVCERLCVYKTGVSKRRVPALMDGLNGPVKFAFREEAENIGW